MPHLDALARDSLHQSAAYELLNRGIANLGVTRRDGRAALKMTLLNPATEMTHIVELMQSLKRLTAQSVQVHGQSANGSHVRSQRQQGAAGPLTPCAREIA